MLVSALAVDCASLASLPERSLFCTQYCNSPAMLLGLAELSEGSEEIDGSDGSDGAVGTAGADKLGTEGAERLLSGLENWARAGWAAKPARAARAMIREFFMLFPMFAGHFL